MINACLEHDHEYKPATLEDQLRIHQIRVTEAAIAILGSIQSANTPVTAESLYERLEMIGKHANLSTIYRTLERFENRGLIRRCDALSGSSSLYEPATRHHHHYFRCCACGRLQLIETCPVENYLRDISKSLNIVVTDHMLTLSGFCEQCKKQKDKLEVLK